MTTLEQLEQRAEALARDFDEAGVTVLIAWAFDTKAPKRGGWVVAGPESGLTALDDVVQLGMEDAHDDRPMCQHGRPTGEMCPHCMGAVKGGTP